VVRWGFLLLVFSVFRLHAASNAVQLREFIAALPTTPQSHAATIVQTPDALVAAWFGGRHERDPGVGIWLSRKLAGQWTPPVEVANGVQASGERLPCWNPVLFLPRHGPLMLFYKVGPDPQYWWGMLKTSTDQGVHWSDARRLADGVLGPIKNKPVQLADGSIVSPSSREDGSWRIQFERSIDGGEQWTLASAVPNPEHIEAIQPSLLRWSGEQLQAIGRTRQNRVFSTWSSDGGRHWSALHLLELANPNSGIDAVSLADGRALLVYNPTDHGKDWWDGRGQPPPAPPSGPRSMTQSAVLMTSRLCSITTTVLPASRSGAARQQLRMSCEVQAGGGLVEDVERAAGGALGSSERELHALRLAARQRGRALAERT
jgi:predicted neuraminidase